MSRSRLRLLVAVLALGWAVLIQADTPLAAHRQAHWLDERVIAWPGMEDTAPLRLEHGAREALDRGAADSVALTPLPGGLPGDLRARYPHLADAPAWALPDLSRDRLRAILREPHRLTAGDDGTSTGLQLPGVLDVLFPYDGPLGVDFRTGAPTFRVWAPTADSVDLLLQSTSAEDETPRAYPMALDPETGVWTRRGEADWNRAFYRFRVTVFDPDLGRLDTRDVTDPYALGLASDSRYAQVVNLEDPDLAPEGWSSLEKPPFTTPEDMMLYELHLRDFSWRDPRVPEAERGTFLAFTHPESLGMRHLARLRAAGVSHLHLLPVFDIATVPERRGDQRLLDEDELAAVAPDSPLPQERVGAVRAEDGYNWGYDPWHYTVPEGSYATEPDGTPRIREFRTMVSALNAAGLRVVMDVVYNHTHAAGKARGSVLDQLVPGYYQRLEANGAVATSTCCANTATEHAMMEKLMIDSVLTWARDYKVDGFRFDLMGHHSLDNMLRLRTALDALTPERDGVDGKAIYLYGEGWNFGEVANDARFVQARQARLAGSGIGSFSDRLRDGVRGGVHGSHPATQGFVNGLGTDPSAYTDANGPGLDRLLETTDWIRTGLAADLADYRFTAADGTLRATSELRYGDQPAGYTADPAENIAYVAAHDNETLFDANQLKLPVATSLADRVRVQALANAFVLLGQGVPFIHAGQEFLRSKSLDRNSYESGDWFNAIDWTFEEGNWGRGLPPAWDNEAHWDIMGPLLANPDLAPTAAARRQALADFEDLLRIRFSSPLFRLRTGEEVQRHLSFHNTGPDQVPGLIVMGLSDPGAEIGGPYREIVVLFNARPEPVTFALPDHAGRTFRLHERQAGLEGAGVEDGRFTAPARSAVVFVAGD